MNEEFIIECVCGFLVILFIAGLSAMKSWLDFKSFKMRHLKPVHPEKYEEPYKRYLNEKYREIRANEYGEYIKRWKFSDKMYVISTIVGYGIILLFLRNVWIAVVGAVGIGLILDRIIGFNAYKERGEIEAEIERKIIIESRKYEELKYSAVSDEILKDNIGERGSEEE